MTSSGECWSFGWGQYGRLGHGNTASYAVAKRIDYFVKNKIKIKKVIPARPNYYDYGGVYFLTTDGRVYFCGYSTYGNAGSGTTTQFVPTPVRCGSLENIVDVFISGLPYSVFAISDSNNGDLWVWGKNHCGQLGLGDTINRLTPVKHHAINQVAKVAAAAGYRTDGKNETAHALVLCRDGSVHAAGYNGFGQLGLGDTTNRTSFVQINHTASFTDVFTGDGRYPSSGLISKGELYLFGYNGYGQLGSGSNNVNNQSLPFKPEAEFQGRVKKAVFGGGVSYEGCIVEAEDNSLWAAGYSGKGNLGYSLAKKNPTFSRVLGQSGVIKQWGCYGKPAAEWGLSVRYSDNRVDACGSNSKAGETGTQVGHFNDVAVLKSVIF